MWSSREDSEEKSPPAEAPAPGPAERKSMTGDDARPAGLLHEPHELSTSTLTKLDGLFECWHEWDRAGGGRR